MPKVEKVKGGFQYKDKSGKPVGGVKKTKKEARKLRKKVRTDTGFMFA